MRRKGSPKEAETGSKQQATQHGPIRFRGSSKPRGREEGAKEKSSRKKQEMNLCAADFNGEVRKDRGEKIAVLR